MTIPDVGTIQIFANGSYSFAPAANYTGAIPAITYTVSDGNGGTDTSTLHLSMAAISDPPEGADKTITILEDGSHTFTAADFGFTDPLDTPADAFKEVIIDTLPATGSLELNGTPVTVGQVIAVADIGDLVWIAPANANGVSIASFDFTVVDDGAFPASCWDRTSSTMAALKPTTFPMRSTLSRCPDISTRLCRMQAPSARPNSLAGTAWCWSRSIRFPVRPATTRCLQCTSSMTPTLRSTACPRRPMASSRAIRASSGKLSAVSHPA